MGLALATCIVAGNMIGSGVFLLPAALARVGSGSLVAWALGLGAAIVLALVFARLATLGPEANGDHPQADGLVAYPARAFPRAVAWLNWAVDWLACWAGNVGILLAMVGYAKSLFGVELTRAGDTAALVAAIWLSAGVNLLGPRFVGGLSAGTLAIGLAPIAAAILAGGLFFDAELFVSGWNVSGEPLWRATPPVVLTLFWAFLGLESANAVAAAVDRPARNVPRAALLGTGLAGLVYMAACVALFGLLPVASLESSSAPFADAIAAAVGPAAGAFIAFAAMARTFGCGSSWFLVAAAANDAAARSGYLSRWFVRGDADAASLSGRSVFFVAGLMTAVALATVSPTLNEQFILIVDATVLMFLFVYVVSAASLYRLSAVRRDRILAAAGVAVCVAVAAGYFLL